MAALRERDPSPKAKWLKVGGLGCAVLLGLGVLLFGSLAALTFRDYGRALGVREDVDRTFGAPDAFRAPADGSVPAGRVAGFLAIRRRLMPRCAEVSEITGSFRGVDEIAHEREPDLGELFARVGQVVHRMPTIGLVFGDYVLERNEALRDHGMSLGEYTWIYVVGYLAYLEQLPARVIDERNRPNVFEDRVYPQVARVIERHVADRRLTGGPWVDELGRLGADHTRVPFRGALPPELVASLEPHRDALADVACPPAAELDVTITVRRSVIGYDHR